MAESAISMKLRIGDMVQIDVAELTQGNRFLAPADFISADFVRNLTDSTALLWKPREEFYNTTDATGFYTTTGNFLTFGGDVAGKRMELHYFGDCPHLTAESGATWLSDRFNALLTAQTLAVACMAMEEPDKAIAWASSAENVVKTLNDRYTLSIGSGSRLNRTRTRARSFG